MTSDYWLFLFILFTAIFLSVKMKKLTLEAAIAGGAVGCCIFIGAGFTGIAMIGLFFLLGTIATAWKIGTKEKIGAAEKNKEGRAIGQVLANGGVAAMLGLLAAIFYGEQKIFPLMMAGAIASATADTLSSELGTVYGKRFYNILSFRYDKRGENGVVSMEGILIGILGTVPIAVAYSIGFGWGIRFCWIVIAGTLGNFADSILGATLERKGYLKNDAVNFINTMAGALMALALLMFFD